MPIQDFLAYHESANIRDKASILAVQYRRALGDIENVRSQCIKYVMPRFNGRSFDLIIDPDFNDEVSKIASSIDQNKKKLRELSSDIELFVQLAKGFSLTEIANKRKANQRAINAVEQEACATIKRAKKVKLKDLAKDKSIQESQLAVKRIHREIDIEQQDYDTILRRCNEIIDKWL